MKVGVIVGRFQTDELTPGHLALIREASKGNNQVLILIGSTHKPPSRNNPLTFEMRRKIVWEGILKDSINPFNKACDIATLPLPDHRDDEQWVRNLDAVIHTFYRNDSVKVYVGRDSGMGPYYKKFNGKHEVVMVTTGDGPSATARRHTIGATDGHGLDPKSIIWTTQQQYPKVYPTVDIAAFDSGGYLTLVRKPTERQWRFPGGFVDPSDVTLEMAAKREFREECGNCEIELRYVGSMRIDDWRYRGESDKIITTLFMGQILWGRVVAGDDVTEYQGVAFPGDASMLVPEHRHLYQMLLDHVNRHGRLAFPPIKRNDA